MKDQTKTTIFTRNFTLLLLGQIFSLLGNGALRFALSMYVLEKTGSAAVFGTLLAVSMIPTILLMPFGGVLADRVSRQKVMVGLDLASGIAVLAAAAAFADSRGIAVTAALLIGIFYIRKRRMQPDNAGKVQRAALVFIRKGLGHIQRIRLTPCPACNVRLHTPIQFLRDKEPADSLRPQQPFMTGKCKKINIAFLH